MIAVDASGKTDSKTYKLVHKTIKDLLPYPILDEESNQFKCVFYDGARNENGCFLPANFKLGVELKVVGKSLEMLREDKYQKYYEDSMSSNAVK